jgi:hypothetical protein
MRPKTACAGQSIDGEVVWRAGLAVADGEPSFRGRDPFRERKALTTHPRRYRSNTIMARVLSERIRIQLLAKSLILRVYDILARHNLLRVSPCYAARRIEENGSYVPVLMAHWTSVFQRCSCFPCSPSHNQHLRALRWFPRSRSRMALGRYPLQRAPELNCVVADGLAESPYLRLGLLQEYSCLSLVMDCRHASLRRADHLMIKNPARNRDLHFELVAKWTNV